MGENQDILGLRHGADGLLRDLIHERCGLYFDDGKLDIFSEKLAPLVRDRGFDSFLEYYYLLKFDSADDQEWRKVVGALTVQETYFWREMDQINSLAELVIPSLVSSNSNAPIRIWSAASATGEEPLTIAMRLNEEGWFERANIEIYASDLSAQALARARGGLFRERAFRVLPLHLKDKYFKPEGKEWRIDSSMLEKIRWSQTNLLERDQTLRLATASVIFCRNVFIYFSPAAVRKVVDLFAERMKTPAFLFTGAAESLLRVTDEFELEEIGDAFAYVKRK